MFLEDESQLFAAGGGDQGNVAAIEASLAHQQTRGNGHTHPAILENIDSEGGAA